MMEYKLNIGEVMTSTRDVRFVCYGLGSCIGLFIQDRTTGQTGAAHIFLPDNKTTTSVFMYGNAPQAIDEILKRMKAEGSNLQTLRAKVTGGATILRGGLVGNCNAESVLKLLTDHKIFLAACDVGGKYCRTAKFESATGLLTINIPEINYCKTF